MFDYFNSPDLIQEMKDTSIAQIGSFSVVLAIVVGTILAFYVIRVIVETIKQKDYSISDDDEIDDDNDEW